MKQSESNTSTIKHQAITPEQVHQQMSLVFNLEEIQALCFDLNVDYENLEGQIKDTKLKSLLIYLAQQEHLFKLEVKLNKIRPQIDWQFAQTDFSILQKAFDQNRNNFLNILQKNWIDGFLCKTLHSEVIKLTITETDVGVLTQEAWRHSWYMVRQRQSTSDEPVVLNKSVGEIFEDSGQGLLILGDPGSGKTITLLQLTKKLLKEARLFGNPMPVVLNLSSWAYEKPPFDDWLVSEIFVQYGVSQGLAKQWLENNSLIYLLDGLDEVSINDREDCIIAINRFREDKPGLPGIVPMAVCSRTADYKMLTQLLNLNTAIQIQLLSDEQISVFLNSIKGTETVRHMLKKDPPLKQLACIPLSLNIMALAYRDKTVKELQEFSTVESRRRHLFDTYIDVMFVHRQLSSKLPFDKSKACHWLTEIASSLVERNMSGFYIESLQPDWLPQGRIRRYYAILYALIYGLVFGFIGCVSGALITEQFYGAIGGFLFGTVFGLLNGNSIDRIQIELVEEIKWKTPDLRFREIKDGLLYGLIVGLFIGWVTEIRIGVISGIGVCLSIWFVYGIVTSITTRETLEKIKPNQGIYSSWKNALRIGCIFGIFSGAIAFLVIGLIFDLLSGFKAGIITSLVFSMYFGFIEYGGKVIFKHYILRWLLTICDILPFSINDKKLIAFLNSMVSNILLYRIGNGYMFIHRSLMEHFAAKHADFEGMKDGG